MLTSEEQRVKELAQSATKGAWQRRDTDIMAAVPIESEVAEEETEWIGVAEWVDPRDADFIVAVQPEATLQLLTRLEETLEENEKLKDKVVELEDYVTDLEEDIRNLGSAGEEGNANS